MVTDDFGGMNMREGWNLEVTSPREDGSLDEILIEEELSEEELIAAEEELSEEELMAAEEEFLVSIQQGNWLDGYLDAMEEWEEE